MSTVHTLTIDIAFNYPVTERSSTTNSSMITLSISIFSSIAASIGTLAQVQRNKK